jgi:hypothetical protein
MQVKNLQGVSRHGVPVIALAMSLFHAADSNASGSLLLLSGAEFSGASNYYWAGFVKPFAGSDLDNGYYQKLSVDYLTYQYQSNGEVSASSPGVVYSIGIGKTNPTQSYSVSLGIYDSNVSTSYPNNQPSSSINRIAPIIGIKGSQLLADNFSIKASGSFTQFGSRDDGYWARVAAELKTNALGRSFSTGPEYIAMGESSIYRIRQVGWFFGDILLGSGYSISLHFGLGRNQDNNQANYAGVTLVKYYE